MGTLNDSRPQPAYPGTQQELYTLIETGWGSYVQYLPDFTNKKTIYTQQVADDELTALALARMMPDEASRAEVHKTLRKKVLDLSLDCLEQWSFLDSYIMDAFPEENYEDKREAAGHGYYRGAQREDWDSVKGLMSSGKGFIAGNATVLAADGGMPGTFAGAFDALKLDFETHHQLFLHAEEEAKRLTDLKVEANNLLFKTMSKMFKDGQRIFRKQAAIREQFIVERVMELIGGSGGTGPEPKTAFFGQVVDTNGNMLAGAILRLSNADGMLEVQTDSNGKYRLEVPELAQPESGTLSAEANGMMPSSRPVTIAPEEEQEQNFTLSPMGPPPPMP
ncbi:MAG: carboxypeptidase-like regulatory domain-containing protein [Flavobacteriales bacterium]|nr:carboxypeptidase-like regulatory domain-containing protein [Flavobacteriales bacterium]